MVLLYWRTSSARGDKSEILALFPIWGEKIILSPKVLLTVGFSILLCIRNKKFPSIPSLLQIFLMNGFWKMVLCTCWDDHVLCHFILSIWCITLIGFWMLKESCIPGITSFIYIHGHIYKKRYKIYTPFYILLYKAW